MRSTGKRVAVGNAARTVTEVRGGMRGNADPAAAYPGAPRWARDADIPWALEAQVWETLDSG